MEWVCECNKYFSVSNGIFIPSLKLNMQFAALNNLLTSTYTAQTAESNITSTVDPSGIYQQVQKNGFFLHMLQCSAYYWEQNGKTVTDHHL